MNELECQSLDNVSRQLRALSWGPDRRVKHYKGCIINDYRFHIRDHDKYRKTQNSWVVVVCEHVQTEINFYGELYDIIELEYLEENCVVLFKCNWWNLGKRRGIAGIRKDEYEVISKNTANKLYNDQRFVLAFQDEQVYYVPDIKLGYDWRVVIKNTPWDKYDFPEALTEELTGDEEPYQQLQTNVVDEIVEVDDGGLSLRRDDILEMEVNVTNVRSKKSTQNDHDFIIDFSEDDEMSYGSEE